MTRLRDHAKRAFGTIPWNLHPLGNHAQRGAWLECTFVPRPERLAGSMTTTTLSLASGGHARWEFLISVDLGGTSPMDRTQQLADIYRDSGLDKVLVTNGLRYFEKQHFSKLKFVRSDSRVRSIELWDHKDGTTVFRIHHSDQAPAWLPEAMREWPQMRTSAKFGTGFNGDPLGPAKALARLLASKQ